VKRITIRNSSEVEKHIKTIELSIEKAISNISKMVENPIELFYRMKFGQIGTDPLSERPLNIIEQLNQTYTYLVSFKAARYIFEELNFQGEINLNIGTASGFDIETLDGSIIGEVFAATSVSSNQKLKKDIARLKGVDTTARKYVFFYTPIDEQTKVDKIQVINKEVRIVHIKL
jgi:hypothetical protein